MLLPAGLAFACAIGLAACAAPADDTASNGDGSIQMQVERQAAGEHMGADGFRYLVYDDLPETVNLRSLASHLDVEYAAPSDIGGSASTSYSYDAEHNLVYTYDYKRFAGGVTMPEAPSEIFDLIKDQIVNGNGSSFGHFYQASDTRLVSAEKTVVNGREMYRISGTMKAVREDRPNPEPDFVMYALRKGDVLVWNAVMDDTTSAPTPKETLDALAYKIATTYHDLGDPMEGRATTLDGR